MEAVRVSKMNSGCYEILNTVNGKRYIGSTATFNKRWNLHRANLRAGEHHSAPLQRAWAKYGSDAFEFNILLFCAPVKEQLFLYEQICFKAFRPEYNAAKVAGSRLGMKNTPEATAKTAAALRGGKHTPEHSYKTGAAHRGKSLPLETKDKISKSLKGKKKPPRTPEHSANIAKSKTGKKLPPRTPEHCANIAKARVGKPFTPEHRENISKGHINFLRRKAHE